jgi:hypothetical protein
MRALFITLLFATLTGCVVPTLNSPREPNQSGTDKPKCCGCQGMTGCAKNADGSTCCKPDDCKCHTASQ